MTNTATISLTNAHGLFADIPVAVLNRAIAATKYRSTDLIRSQAAGCCGFPEYDWIAGEAGPYDADSRIEVLMMWIESGNHTF